MSLEPGHAGKLFADYGDPEMALAPGAGVPRMSSAFVSDLQLYRAQRILHQSPDAINPAGCRGIPHQRWLARLLSQSACRTAKIISSAVSPNTLKLTQNRSLALYATHRLAAPSTA